MTQLIHNHDEEESELLEREIWNIVGEDEDDIDFVVDQVGDIVSNEELLRHENDILKLNLISHDSIPFVGFGNSKKERKLQASSSEVYKSQYVKDNYLEQSCWLSLLLDIYKTPIEKWYKKVDLTYQPLHNIIAPDKDLNIIENGYYFDEILNFFKMYKIAIYLFDINLNIVNFYEPNIRNSHIAPFVLYVVFHDKHIYRLDNNIKKLEQKLKDKMEKRVEVCSIPSSKFYIMKRDEEINSRMINTYEDLMEIANEPVENIKETIDIHILYNKPSCFDLWLELYKKGIQAKVLMTNNQICFKHMRLDGINNKNLIISILEEEGVYSHTEFEDEEIFKHYTSKKIFVSNNLLTNNYKSEYNQATKIMIDNYMKIAIKGRFNDTSYEIVRGIKLDFNKFYTSILMNMKKIPVINGFDEFIPYNGSELKEYNLYFVEKLDIKQTYPLNKYSVCYGLNLLGVENIKIISYLQVSKLKKNVAEVIVKNIYDRLIDKGPIN